MDARCFAGSQIALPPAPRTSSVSASASYHAPPLGDSYTRRAREGTVNAPSPYASSSSSSEWQATPLGCKAAKRPWAACRSSGSPRRVNRTPWKSTAALEAAVGGDGIDGGEDRPRVGSLEIRLAVAHDPAMSLVPTVELGEAEDELHIRARTAEEAVPRDAACQAGLMQERDPAREDPLDERRDTGKLGRIFRRRRRLALQKACEVGEAQPDEDARE